MTGRGRRSGRTVLLALLPGAAALACGAEGGPGADAWSGTMTDSGGVTIVTNTGDPAWDASGAWTLEEVLRIGRPEDPAYEFGQISGIGVTSDGRIWLMDQQAQRLQVYGPEGAHVATVGAAGSGPGEFGVGAGPVLVAPGDTILVPDPSNQRVNRFGPEGESAGSFRMSFEQGIPMAWADGPDGALVSQVRPIALPGQAGVDTLDSILERATDGSVTDTVFRMPSGKTFSMAGGAPEFTFFVAEPTWALRAGGGLAFGVNDRYEIRLYDDDGELERIVRQPFERVPVTGRDQEIFRSTLERLWREAGVPPQATQNLARAVSFAESFPAYARFLAGPDGSLWVQHIVRPSDMSVEEQESFNPLLSLGSSGWDVFDAEGRYLGAVEMPPRFQPLRFQGDRIYGVWRDELDLQHVLALRIVGPELPGAAGATVG